MRPFLTRPAVIDWLQWAEFDGKNETPIDYPQMALNLIAEYDRAAKTSISVVDETGRFKTIAEIERDYLVMLLEHHNCNKLETARTIGCSIKTIYNKLREHGLWDKYTKFGWLKRELGIENEATDFEAV